MTEWVHERDGLTISVSVKGSKAKVEWKGTSDARSPSAFLTPLLQDLSSKLKSCNVTVDFTGLEYMNSATVMPLIGFIRQLDRNGQPIVVMFRDVDWQRTQRNCMTALSRTLKNVRVQ
jgi:anti-anti-sigma regulatory factor